MKIIVYPHTMEIGGSQLNAIEIGAAVQRLGHEVLLVAEPGPLQRNAADLGLEVHEVPLRRQRPSPRVSRTLTELVRARGIDVVHGYEWPPALDAWFGPGLRLGTAVTATVMSAHVAPFLPRSIPLVVGTQELADRCSRHDGFRDVALLEPPVDVESNHPDFDAGDFRTSLGLGSGTVLVAVVCRLARELKLEGLLVACGVVAELAVEGFDVALAVVGDGPAGEEVRSAARSANATAGRPVVHMVGELADPRPAYAGADVMLGMGGSALRAMAFAKPLVVQGELGFWSRCDENTVRQFLDGGWYGLGEGAATGRTRLRSALLPLVEDVGLRRRLGEFARRVVVERFSLDHAAHVQEGLYRQAIEGSRRPAPAEVARTLRMLIPFRARRTVQRRLGIGATDDFNAINGRS